MTQADLNKRLVQAIQQLDVPAVETYLVEGGDPNSVAEGIAIKSFVHGEVRSNPYAIELLFEKSMFDPETHKIRPEAEHILLALIEKGVNPDIYVNTFAKTDEAIVLSPELRCS